MIFNMVGGGGTGGASIFIVNSVNQRPTNVFSNTLWVNTDVDVVKYVFSDNEPSNPTEGMLWLTISNSDNVNVVAPINKDWMKFNLGIVKQYIDGVWERKVAQLYKDGIWVDVSRMFSASINITYPATSTCVVTNSSGQTVASDTNAGSSSKTWTATVGAIGTYTVTATATDGSGKSKSQNVSITADGQSVSVELLYNKYEYYMNGVKIIPFEAIYDRVGSQYGSVTENATSVTISSGGFNVAVGYISSNSVDLSKVHTLCCKITNITGQTSRSDIGLRISVCDTKIGYNNGGGRIDTAVVNIPANELTEDGVYYLDLPSLNSGYIGVYSYGFFDVSVHGVTFDMVEFYAT